MVKRKKEIEPKQGDVFEIPLEDGRFGYGQVLNYTTYGFFDLASKERLPLEQIVEASVAFRVGCSSAAIGTGRWQILANVPLTTEMRQPLRLFRNNGPDWWFLHEWRPETGTHDRRVLREEVTGLEYAGLWTPSGIEERLLMHLRGEPCPWIKIAQ